jgi:hypothetical protein
MRKSVKSPLTSPTGDGGVPGHGSPTVQGGVSQGTQQAKEKERDNITK